MGAIGFGPGVPYGAYSQPHYQAEAQQKVHPLWLRVYFAAMGWHDINGHAPFYINELAEILDVRGDSASRAVKEARERGLICEDSTVRCLRLNPLAHQKGFGGAKSCVPHGSRLGHVGHAIYRHSGPPLDEGRQA